MNNIILSFYIKILSSEAGFSFLLPVTPFFAILNFTLFKVSVVKALYVHHISPRLFQIQTLHLVLIALHFAFYFCNMKLQSVSRRIYFENYHFVPSTLHCALQQISLDIVCIDISAVTSLSTVYVHFEVVFYSIHRDSVMWRILALARLPSKLLNFLKKSSMTLPARYEVSKQMLP